MADIKIKQKGIIKQKNHSKVNIINNKINRNIIGAKSKIENYKENNEQTAEQYGVEKVSNGIKIVTNKGIKKFKNYGIKSIKETRNNLQEIKQKNISVLNKNQNYSKNKTIKPKVTVKKSNKNIKKISKNAVSMVKGIISGTKALITFLCAGGFIAFILIVVICLIALICSSMFGIFFSNEKSGNNNTLMSTAILKLNTEFANKITDIQKNNTYDEYVINSNRAEWKDILSVYAVEVTQGKEQSDVMLLDDYKIERLRKVFWDMNVVTSWIETIKTYSHYTDEEGNTRTKVHTKKILHIDIKGKTIDEMREQYSFNEEQNKQLSEIQREDYDQMWKNLLNGLLVGSTDIVQVALAQIGNVGGEPYWSWYGFEERVEWCACFVSWCANQCGYIEAGIIPKFSSCEIEGVGWFKTIGLWQDGGYTPKPGDIIFFDWMDKHDGRADHVGIVEKCEDGIVYTVEGNTKGDMCKQNRYSVNSSVIHGYGTPIY